MSNSLWPLGLQHARPPCPSPTPGVYSNSCPSSRWCHPTISSSVVPFSSCPKSFPASGSFPMSQFFASGGQSIGWSISFSMSTSSENSGLISFTMDWLDLLAVQKHQFFDIDIILVFAIHWYESAMGLHVFPILAPLPSPSPSHPSGSSQCTSPEHPVSCIEHGLVIGFTYANIHVSLLFYQIIPPLPSPTGSKSLLYTSVDSFSVSYIGLVLPSF